MPCRQVTRNHLGLRPGSAFGLKIEGIARTGGVALA
jgi:hypothetical protein